MGLTVIDGDRDIIAVHRHEKLVVVVEVEGVSSGQPESKLYKAIGQIVMATSVRNDSGLERRYVLAVHGEEIARHLAKAIALEKLGVSGVSIGARKSDDKWLFVAPITIGP